MDSRAPAPSTIRKSHWFADVAAQFDTFDVPSDAAGFEELLQSNRSETKPAREIQRILAGDTWREAAEEGERTGDWSAAGRLLQLPELRAVLASL